MGNKKALGFGLLGLVVGAATGGAGKVAIGALRGFAIGYSLGSYIFPPEQEVEEDDDFDVTGPRDGQAIPVIWGFRETSGGIIHFGFGDEEKRTKKDEKYWWAPMAIALCAADEIKLIRIIDNQGKGWRGRNFLTAGSYGVGDEVTMRYVARKSGLNPDDLDNPNWYHALPWLSEGGDPIDFQNLFTVQGLGEGYYTYSQNEDGSQNKIYHPPPTFDWPAAIDLPKLPGVCWLAHPRWWMGKGVTSAPSLKFRIRTFPTLWDQGDIAWAYPKETYTASTTGFNPAHAYAEVLRNDEQWLGLPVSLINTGSLLYAETLFDSEGIELNASLEGRQSVKAMLEQLNFHTTSAVRTDAAGRLEVLPIRDLSDASAGYPTVDYSTGTVDAAVDGKPTIWVIRDEDINEIELHTDTWDTIPNEFYGKCHGPSTQQFKEVGHTIRNEAAYSEVGNWIRQEYDFPFFTNPDLMRDRLHKLVRRQSRPKTALTVQLDHRFEGVRQFDGILVYSDEFQLNGVYFRVDDIQTPELGNARIELRATMDLLAVSAGLTSDGQEDDDDELDLTELSAANAGAHVDLWPSNVSFDDTVTPAAAAPTDHGDPDTLQGIHVYASKARQISSAGSSSTFCHHTALGPSTAGGVDQGGSPVPALPDHSACTQEAEQWDHLFTLQADLRADDFRHAALAADGGKKLLLRLASYEDEVVSDIDRLLDKDWESEQLCLVISGIPQDGIHESRLKPLQPAVEVLRFKKLTRVLDRTDGDPDVYEIEGVLRGANNEQAFSWPAGSAVWLHKMQNSARPPAVPDGTLGVLSGTGNFGFTATGADHEWGKWIQLFADASDLRNGNQADGNPALQNLADDGHVFASGADGEVFDEGVDYILEQDSGKVYFWHPEDPNRPGGATIEAADFPLDVTLQLGLGTQWAHRHQAAPLVAALPAFGAERLRIYTQGIEKDALGVVIDQETLEEGLVEDLDPSNSNFFNRSHRNRAGLFAPAAALAYDDSVPDEMAYRSNGTLELWDDQEARDWPNTRRVNIFNDLVTWPGDWSVKGDEPAGCTLTWGIEQVTNSGVVCDFSRTGNPPVQEGYGFYVEIVNIAGFPGGTFRLPRVVINPSSGSGTTINPDTTSDPPEHFALSTDMTGPLTVIIKNETDGDVSYEAWLGYGAGAVKICSNKVTPAGGVGLRSATGNIRFMANGGLGADVVGPFGFCPRPIDPADIQDTRLDSATCPIWPGTMVFLPMDSGHMYNDGNDVAADISGYGHDCIFYGGAVGATIAPSWADRVIVEEDVIVDVMPYRTRYEYSAGNTRAGLGEGWIENDTKPSGWPLLRNLAGTEGADEADINDYEDAANYPEYQGMVFRLDVYHRGTGAFTQGVDPEFGEGVLLRSGAPAGLKVPGRFDPQLLIEVGTRRWASRWPFFVYTTAMQRDDEAYLETLAAGKWDPSLLYFVVYAGLRKIPTNGAPIIQWSPPLVADNLASMMHDHTWAFQWEFDGVQTND